MLKKVILNLLVKTDAFAAIRYLNRGKVPILMYHRFSENDSPFSTSKSDFRNHLTYLKKHYQIISLQQLTANLRAGNKLPEKTVAITIDDGYQDVYDIAFPILKEFEAHATVFAVTDFLDKKCWIWTDKARYLLLNSTKTSLEFEIGSGLHSFNFKDENSRIRIAAKINSELKKLETNERENAIKKISGLLHVQMPELPTKGFDSFNWENALEMQKSGISIESHTVSHPILTNISDENLNVELANSRKRIQDELQKDGELFCYPNGNCGSREQIAAKNAGYSAAVSTDLRLCTNAENMFSLPRIDCEPEMTRFIQATSGFDELKA